ncbi:DUF4870 domain-containing protein [Thermogemmatispora sp.]|uniref:DUF4870 domain-containing protein n=1 Tax=Thermogemmatispora sp. TaxID=1968838 RepID=UPI0035E45C70
MYAPAAEWLPPAGDRLEYGETEGAESGASSTEAILGILSYLGGWLSGLLVLLFGGRSPLVRFHALQSFFFFGLVTLIDIGMLMILFYTGSLPLWLIPSGLVFVAFLFWLLLLGTLQVVAVTGWLVGMIQAARRRFYLMPVVGHLALALAGVERRENLLKP